MNSYKILSYNIFWKSMVGKQKDFLPVIDARDNVLSVINNNYDIVCLQEVAVWNILKKKIQKHYQHISIFSGNEQMVTLYNKDKFRKMFMIQDEFKEGRPILMIGLKDKETKQIVLVINVHAPHKWEENGNSTDIRKKLNKIVHSVEHHYDRIILVGDFNEFKSKTIKLGNISLKTKVSNLKTCYYPDYKGGCDHIYTQTEPKIKIVKSKHPSSDHLPIQTKMKRK